MTSVGRRPREVVVQVGRPTTWLLDHTWRILMSGLMTLTLTYFLLAWGDTLLDRVLESRANRRSPNRAALLIRQVQRELSVYFLTVGIINFLLGALTALVLWRLNMPNPALWGTMVALLNFLPYLGAIASTVILSLVALGWYDTLTQAALVPGVFLVLTIVEGQFVTPTVVGRRMTLNPLVVFLCLMVWTWLWGIVGAFLSMPILMAVRIIADASPVLRRFGEILKG